MTKVNRKPKIQNCMIYGVMNADEPLFIFEADGTVTPNLDGVLIVPLNIISKEIMSQIDAAHKAKYPTIHKTYETNAEISAADIDNLKHDYKKYS